jgi:hypothetical protein
MKRRESDHRNLRVKFGNRIEYGLFLHISTRIPSVPI